MAEPCPLVIGIDPGFTGGLAALSLDGRVLDCRPMPILEDRRKTVHGAELARWLRRLDSRIDGLTVRLVVVEEPGQRPHAGKDADADGRDQSRGFRSNGTQLREVGRIEGVLDALGLPVRLIQARRWQESVLGALPAGCRGHDARRKLRKQQSIAFATRRFPDANLVPGRCRKPQDGISDAIGICEYGRRVLVGKVEPEGRGVVA